MKIIAGRAYDVKSLLTEIFVYVTTKSSQSNKARDTWSCVANDHESIYIYASNSPLVTKS